MNLLMSIETYTAYLFVIAVFFAAPPGTSQLLIVSNSIRYGIRSSGFTIVGDLSANTLQILVTAVGLDVLLTSSPYVLNWIKWLGVVYLIWIGLEVFRSNKLGLADNSEPSYASPLKLFSQGFFTSLSNPYAVIFFAALFPQFIDSEYPIFQQVSILGITYLVVDGIMLVVWANVGVRAAYFISKVSTKLVGQLCGVLMIGAAMILASKNVSIH